MIFQIGVTVWFEGKKWEVADRMPQNNTYALGVRNAEGTWGKGSKSYGFIKDTCKADPNCPFDLGFVPARYISKALNKAVN